MKPLLFTYLSASLGVVLATKVAAADPNPVILGNFRADGASYDHIAVAGNYVYVLSRPPDENRQAGQLHVIDARNDSNLQRVALLDLESAPLAMALAGDYALLLTSTLRDDGFGRTNSVHVVDVRNPLSPTRTARVGVSGDSMVVDGNRAFTGSEVVDVSNPRDPRVAAYQPMFDPPGEPLMAIADGILYSPRWGYGIGLHDVSDPLSPRPIATYGHKEGPGPYELDVTSIAISDTFAFLAVTTDSTFSIPRPQGLEIIDISVPNDPQPVGAYITSAEVPIVASSGDHVFLAGESGLLVLDVSDPTRPRRVGGNHGFAAEAIAVQGERIYVAAGTQGLIILNVPTEGAAVPPRFAAPIRLGQTGVRLSLSGPVGRTATVQRSRGLATWEDWLSVRLLEVPVEVTDDGAREQQASFYRLVLK